MSGGKVMRETPKGFASLSSGLLARKGMAKPAMRPQGFGQLAVGLEDLGWNDMGTAPVEPSFAGYAEPPVERVPSSISALTPAPRNSGDAIESPATPVVIEQQRAIAESFGAAEPEADAEEVVTAAMPAPTPLPARPRREKVQAIVAATRARAEAGAKAKTAFTLRLDSERHLRLRLACAVSNRSAQQIVSAALDAYLDQLPEVEALASQVPARPN